MVKALVFDVDGTIANLYSVPDWLPKLRSEDESPYVNAPPMVDFYRLYAILDEFKKRFGTKIIVTTWLSKGSTPNYDKKVTRAKKEWLKRYEFPYDEIHCVPYGTPKHKLTAYLGGEQILIDDDEKVRSAWNLGETINANEDIISALQDIIRRLAHV